MASPTRKERDLLGEREVPASALWGIHTLRAVENFPLSGRRTAPALIHAYGLVKQACARTNRELGSLPGARRGHRNGRGRDGRGQARRAHPGGRVARRGGNVAQHERQRGAGQPCAGLCSAARTRRLRGHRSARPREHAPVDQRHLSHGAEGGGHRQPAHWKRLWSSCRRRFSAKSASWPTW
jgi:hypothetical protein